MLQCFDCGKELSEAEVDFCKNCQDKHKIITTRGKQIKDYNIKLKWSHYELPGFIYDPRSNGWIPKKEKDEYGKNNNNVRKKER